MKKLTKELKNTDLILARFSYKGGDNNPSLKHKRDFSGFSMLCHDCENATTWLIFGMYPPWPLYFD